MGNDVVEIEVEGLATFKIHDAERSGGARASIYWRECPDGASNEDGMALLSH